MNKKSVNAITKAYSILHNEIENDRDLKKHGLSVSDYYAACETMEKLRSPGSSAKCFIGNVASFFRECGYSVELEENRVNYIISCEN